MKSMNARADLDDTTDERSLRGTHERNHRQASVRVGATGLRVGELFSRYFGKVQNAFRIF
jgi:hypothetical protein